MSDLPFLVEITPDVGEGYFDGAKVGRPLPFDVRIEEAGAPFRSLTAWSGSVVAGQQPYVGRKCYLRERLLNTSLNDGSGDMGMVVYILDDDGKEIFSGICLAKVLS